MPAAAIAVASEACEEGLEFRAVRGRTRAALPVYAASGRLHPAPDHFTRSRHVVDPCLAVFREGKTQPLNLPAGALQRRGHFVLECAIRQQLLAEKINPRDACCIIGGSQTLTVQSVRVVHVMPRLSKTGASRSKSAQPCRPERPIRPEIELSALSAFPVAVRKSLDHSRDMATDGRRGGLRFVLLK
jgi:hypothetical protein